MYLGIIMLFIIGVSIGLGIWSLVNIFQCKKIENEILKRNQENLNRQYDFYRIVLGESRDKKNQ